jgi:hypothetical protein
MSDEELVKRLRKRQEFESIDGYKRIEWKDEDALEAADRIEALTAKLAAAVDWFETIRDRAKGDYMAHTYYLDALAALATIKRREP